MVVTRTCLAGSRLGGRIYGAIRSKDGRASDTGSSFFAFFFAVLLGTGFGARLPLTTAVRGVYFGRRAFAAITGISMLPMNVFLIAAPLFAGYMFDYTGSYATPFVTVAVVSFLGSVLFLFLGKPPGPRLGSD